MLIVVNHSKMYPKLGKKTAYMCLFIGFFIWYVFWFTHKINIWHHSTCVYDSRLHCNNCCLTHVIAVYKIPFLSDKILDENFKYDRKKSIECFRQICIYNYQNLKNGFSNVFTELSLIYVQITRSFSCHTSIL